MAKWYYYLHTNKDVISKNPVVADSDQDYFNSPFVEKLYEIDTADRMSLLDMLIDLKERQALPERIKQLEMNSGVQPEDYIIHERLKNGETIEKIMVDIQKDQDTFRGETLKRVIIKISENEPGWKAKVIDKIGGDFGKGWMTCFIEKELAPGLPDGNLKELIINQLDRSFFQ